MADIVVDGSHVNLTRPPIVCAVKTDKPLPAEAWAIVGELAYAIEKASDRLRVVGAKPEPDDG